MTDPIQPATDAMIERLRPHYSDGDKDVVPALIARIDAERAALTESEAVRDRMRALLDAVAVAVRGPPAPNALHDHARLPDEVAALVGRVWNAEAHAHNLAVIVSRHGAERRATVARAERAEGALAQAVAMLRETQHADLAAIIEARAALSQEKGGGK